jgi:hypothetical protein
MKLISMTDFVLEQGNPSNTDSQFADKVMGYANFLKTPLKLEMFVPCDKYGNILKKPNSNDYNEETNGWFNAICVYADQQVLFEGFEFFDNHKNCLNNMLGDYGFFNITNDFSIPTNNFGIITHEKGKGYHTYFHIKTIEDLIRIEKGISLTQNAIKQLGL